MAQIETTDLDRIEKEALLILDNLQKNYHGCVREGVSDILEIVNKVRNVAQFDQAQSTETELYSTKLSKSGAPVAEVRAAQKVEAMQQSVVKVLTDIKGKNEST